MTIQHVTLEVRPQDAARLGRLIELLGFERIDPPEGLGDGFVWLERGGCQFHLELREDAVAPPRGHAAVVAAGFEETLERLALEGFETRRTRELWGAPRAFVALPGGGRMELMKAPPEPRSADGARRASR